MGTPSADDPLGLRPDPTSFDEAIGKVVDARIEHRLRGRAYDTLGGVPDMKLVQELLARGWAVFRPKSQDPSS